MSHAVWLPEGLRISQDGCRINLCSPACRQPPGERGHRNQQSAGAHHRSCVSGLDVVEERRGELRGPDAADEPESLQVFTVTDTWPNTFGDFATVLNPHSTESTDTLVITRSNSPDVCCPNATGLSNIST